MTRRPVTIFTTGTVKMHSIPQVENIRLFRLDGRVKPARQRFLMRFSPVLWNNQEGGHLDAWELLVTSSWLHINNPL